MSKPSDDDPLLISPLSGIDPESRFRVHVTDTTGSVLAHAVNARDEAIKKQPARYSTKKPEARVSPTPKKVTQKPSLHKESMLKQATVLAARLEKQHAASGAWRTTATKDSMWDQPPKFGPRLAKLKAGKKTNRLSSAAVISGQVAAESHNMKAAAGAHLAEVRGKAAKKREMKEMAQDKARMSLREAQRDSKKATVAQDPTELTEAERHAVVVQRREQQAAKIQTKSERIKEEMKVLGPRLTREREAALAKQAEEQMHDHNVLFEHSNEATVLDTATVL